MRPVAQPAQIVASVPPEPPEHFGAQPFDPGAEVRIKYVRVTNNGDIPFTDRHDGVPVRIDPGKSDNFPLDMAEHFFGNPSDPETMFRHVCRRQGWNTPAHLQPSEENPRMTVAQMLFSKLEIKPVVYKMVEEKVDLNEPIPADPQVPGLADDELPELPKRKAKAS
jgi:hypothetical protein